MWVVNEYALVPNVYMDIPVVCAFNMDETCKNAKEDDDLKA